jgi:hypothetical protein
MKYDPSPFYRFFSTFTFQLPRLLGVVATISRFVNRYAAAFIVCSVLLSIYSVYSISTNNTIVEDNKHHSTEMSYFVKTTTDVSLRDYLREHFIFVGINKQPGLGVKQAVFSEPSRDCYHAFELNRQYAFNVATSVHDDHIECELCFDEAACPYAIKLDHISNENVSLVVYNKPAESGSSRVVFKDEFMLKKRPKFKIDSDDFDDYVNSLNKLKVYDSDAFISTFVTDDSDYPQTLMKFCFMDKQGKSYVVYNHHNLFVFDEGQWHTMKKHCSDCPMMIVEKIIEVVLITHFGSPGRIVPLQKKQVFQKKNIVFRNCQRKFN